MRHRLHASFAAILSLTSATAAWSDQIETAVNASFLPGWKQQNGQFVAAVKLTLAPGWKTYWRAPGDAGIPPRIDWRGSHNLASAEALWPTPIVFDQNGMTSVGYKEDVIVPIVLRPKSGTRDLKLKAEMAIGVCKEICVPATLHFQARLDGHSTTIIPEIAAALVDQPYSAEEAQLTSATCAMEPTADGMKVTARLTLPSTGGPEFGVIETNDPELWVSEAKTVRSGGSLHLTSDIIHVEEKPFFLERKSLRFTVLGQKYAVDVKGCEAG